MVKDPLGIFASYEAVSPEAIKAQRMQELADIAEFRKRHLDVMINWSKKDYREKLQQHLAEERTKAIANLDPNVQDSQVMRKWEGERALPLKMNITLIDKPAPKKSLGQKLRSWLWPTSTQSKSSSSSG